MIRATLLLAALLAAGCAAPPQSDQSSRPRAQRQTDMLCMNDCLGSGGARAFWQDRFTYYATLADYPISQPPAPNARPLRPRAAPKRPVDPPPPPPPGSPYR